MDYNIKKNQEFTVLTVEQDIDGDFVEELRKVLCQLAENNKNIICDFKLVRYMNSQGLGLISEVVRIMRRRNGKIKLIVTSEKLRQLIITVHLDKVVDIYDSKEEAVKDLEETPKI